MQGRETEPSSTFGYHINSSQYRRLRNVRWLRTDFISPFSFLVYKIPTPRDLSRCCRYAFWLQTRKELYGLHYTTAGHKVLRTVGIEVRHPIFHVKVLGRYQKLFVQRYIALCALEPDVTYPKKTFWTSKLLSYTSNNDLPEAVD